MVVCLHTVLYAALHFLVDMVCAWSMFAFFSKGNYESFLIYNFCAFALQMPLGAMLDLLRNKMHRLPAACASLGAFVTALGALIHPVILGFGNALFHVGAGVGVIEEDTAKNLKGRSLGLFVAPGAIGLYVGTKLGKAMATPAVLLIAGIVMVVFLAALFLSKRCKQFALAPNVHGNTILLALCCFAVVIMRSWIGLAISFSWKSDPTLAFLAVLCTAGGKLAGGLLAARFGVAKTASTSLLASSVFYLLAERPLIGLAAIFLFNMSMPLTLYLLVQQLPHLPGFAFGLLTFGLFLGFLPVYAGIPLPVSSPVFGAAGSLISAIALTVAGKAANYGKLSV